MQSTEQHSTAPHRAAPEPNIYASEPTAKCNTLSARKNNKHVFAAAIFSNGLKVHGASSVSSGFQARITHKTTVHVFL